MIFAKIDWTNAVVIPFAMWFILGIPLALLTGFIAARYLEWHRVKSEALQEFVRLPETLGNAAFAANPFAVSNVFHYFLHKHPLELQNMGQIAAGAEVKAIRDSVKNASIAAINKMDPYVLTGLRNSDRRFDVVVSAGESTRAENSVYLVQLCRLEPRLHIFFTGAIADIFHLVGARAIGETITKEQKKETESVGEIL